MAFFVVGGPFLLGAIYLADFRYRGPRGGGGGWNSTGKMTTGIDSVQPRLNARASFLPLFLVDSTPRRGL